MSIHFLQYSHIEMNACTSCASDGGVQEEMRNIWSVLGYLCMLYVSG